MTPATAQRARPARRPAQPPHRAAGRPRDEGVTGSRATAARSAGLDGLRGLAALSVLGYHVYLYGRPSRATHAWEAFPLRLSMGLLLFFVLSGFLLYRSFERAARRQRAPVDLRSYLARRAARILPAYYVCMIAIYPLLRAAAGSPGVHVRLPDTGDLWLFALMGQNYSGDTVLSFNPVTWTLVVELAFYALLPLLGWFAFARARGRRQPQMALALGLVAVGLAWHALVYLGDLPQTFFRALPGWLPYFAIGILGALIAGRWEERGRAPGRAATAMLGIGGLLLVVANGVWHSLPGGALNGALLGIVQDLPAGVGFGLIVLAVATGSGRWSTWAAARPLAAAGVISYGVYLWQIPVILYLQHLGLAGHSMLILGLAALPLTLAVGAASWHLVERPLIARAHRRRLVAPGRVERAAPEAAA